MAACRIPLHHGQATDHDKLVKDRAPAEKCAVGHLNMTGEEDVIGHDDTMTEKAVVAQVAPGHEKIVVAYHGVRIFQCGAVDRDMFADRIVAPDAHAGVLPLHLKSQILRIRSQDRPVPDFRPLAEHDTVFQNHVRSDHATRANLRLRPDNRVGPDLDVIRQLSPVGHKRGGMDVHGS